MFPLFTFVYGCTSVASPDRRSGSIPPKDGFIVREGNLVTEVTPVAPPSGFVSASLVDPAVELAVTIGGIALAQAWEPKEDAAYRLWKLPDDVLPGETELLFRAPDGTVDPVPFIVGERWFEEVASVVGLGGIHQVVGWDAGCAESLTGFGLADLDLDGDLDIVRGHISEPARLLLNDGDIDGDGLPNFVDYTIPLGFIGHDLVASVQFADYDNDGDPDVFIGRRGPNHLLENRLVPEGQLRFQDVSAQSGLAQLDQRTTGMAFGDYDNDGDLDLYEVNHSWCFPGLDVEPNASDHLYRNNGDSTFTEVTALLPDFSGQVSSRFGFLAIFVDADRDLDQDLWVVNDWVETGGRSVYFRNNGFGNFTDVSDTSGISPLRDSFGKGINAMGGAVGDINRDGYADFAFSNIGPNFLVESIDSQLWADRAFERNCQRANHSWGEQSVTWGTHLLDIDLDQDLDLFFVGGSIKSDTLQPHALFENQGAEMLERTWEAGLASPGQGASSAQVDLDGDGYLDLIVANWGGPLEVWHNLLGQRATRHWLVVDLVGDGEVVNRDAFGAVVELLYADNTADTCFRTPMPSMSSSGDWGCHFGLGEVPSVSKVRVIWPNGVVQTAPVLGIDQRMKVIYAP